MSLEYLLEFVPPVLELALSLLFDSPLMGIITMPEENNPKEAKVAHQTGTGRRALPEFLLVQPNQARSPEQLGKNGLILPGFLRTSPTEESTAEKHGASDSSKQSDSSSYIWDREIDGVCGTGE
jgi:hypothetical protein